MNPSVESCDDGTFATTTTSGTITDTPAPGSLFWFIVTATNGSGEGTPGTASPGARLQNVSGTCLPSCGSAGALCSVDADCCSASCIAGTCQSACCQPPAGFCTADSDCCSGVCSGGQCQSLCSNASQCPDADTECRQRTCTAGACGFSFTAAGTQTSSQTPGDCRNNQCDGAGNIVSLADDSDLPADDGNQCTNDTCFNGAPSHSPKPINSPCSQNGGNVCNGSGTCVECTTASQCPGTDNDCRQRTCSSFTCGAMFAQAGTPTSSQTPGDCQVRQCDGSGNIVSAPDNSDFPADDGNQCTDDTCSNGAPSHPNKPLNSPCSQNGGSVCNGTGTCVECVSASQCPGTDTECRQRSCTNATCGMSNTPAGTPTASQNPGDCQVRQCDGSGNAVNVGDPTDIPADDGNQCTNEACISGFPSHPAAPSGTTCNQSGGSVCDGSGNCVVPPQVVSTVPADGAVTPANTSISVTFSQAMDPTTLTGQTGAGSCSGTVEVSLDNFASCIAFSSASATMSVGNTVATFVPQPGLLVNRTYKIRVTTNAKNASSIPLSATFTQATGFTTTSPNICDGSLVISQIYGGSSQTGSAYKNDFIELHNRGSVSVSTAGMSVQYASATGSTWLVTNLVTKVIPPGGYYLIQEFGGTTGAASLPTPDATDNRDLANANGKVALASNTTALIGACPTGGAIIDFVGYGSTANCSEGLNAASPSTTNSISRIQSGCTDINFNSTDFVAGAAAPRNIASAQIICSCIAQNESNNPLEADYCAVTFPLTLTVQTGTSTGSIFGQIYETGLTEPAGTSALVRAQLGYGPATVNPEYQVGFTWLNASYNVQSGNNDEYQGSFTAPAAGSYRYVYRFSVDQGVSWTYCDANQGDFGSGSSAGLTFDLENMPVLTVTP